MKKKIIALLCAAAALQSLYIVSAEYKDTDLKSAIDSAIKWKEDNDSPFYNSGSYGSDFYVMALKRMGKSYDYGSYLANLDGIAAGYGVEHNATDMQRTVLATLAAGGDAGNVGGRDLVADATYYRNATAPMDKDGVDGYSWALIALDSNLYETPDWAVMNRNQIIAGMLSHQNTDGSFGGSVYSTASAIIALAPYYETSGAYTITQTQTGYTVDLSPHDAVESALGYLSNEQKREGDWGDLKSTAMTVIALDTMGINSDGDSRFTSGKGTAFEGMMLYQNRDGGFTNDSGRSDGDATSLALCAMTSRLRKIQGKSNLFAFYVNDSVTFETPQASTGNTASSNSGSSVSKPTVTVRPKVTVKPSASRIPSATIKPKTIKPKTSTFPIVTMKPTKTTTPMEQVTPEPKQSPKATKKPALVGPPEMPGPLETQEPDSGINKNGDSNSKSSGSVAVAVISIILVLAVLAALALLYVKNKYFKKKNTAAMRHEKYSRQGKERQKQKHQPQRRTSQHRHYEERERYRARRKYDRRRY